MVIRVGTLIAVSLLASACGTDKDDPIRFEYKATTPQPCAETDIGFHPGSAELTGAAEDILFETVDRVAGDCEDGKIEITAWRNDEGDDLANERIASIESAIRSGYGLPNHYMTSTVEDPPSEDRAGRVNITLITETAAGD